MSGVRLTAVASLLLSVSTPSGAQALTDRTMAMQAERLFPILRSASEAGPRAELSPILGERRRRIEACGEATDCVLSAAAWTSPERAAAIASLSQQRSATGTRTQDTMRAEGIRREIDGINSILSVYGRGNQPGRYPLIDGPADENFLAFSSRVADAIVLAQAAREDPANAFDPSIGIALALLDVSNRNDASSYEPITGGMNASAMARARTIDWKKYPYTAILVTGIGPEDLNTVLSPKGKLNVRMAASLFAQGKAPFVIFSGGAVHPRGARYNEAVQMRHALMERFGVPADAIVIEPYARHTTTNLRNFSRLLIALGAPLDRDALISTYVEQSRDIESEAFAARNRAELGYEPGTVGRRLTPHQLLFRPSTASLLVDPTDPLDP